MQRYLLKIAYIGTRYNGVTKNLKLKNHVSIEGIIESALGKISTIKKAEIFPSSRTDAGVHATNSAVHIDLDPGIPPHVITKKLNASFQFWHEQLRILKTIPVSSEFDSRRDAISRTYLYRFAVDKNLMPPGMNPKIFRSQKFIPIEESFRCCFISNEGFEIDRLKEAAKLLEGSHDFRSFMKVSKEQKTLRPRFTYRTLDSIKVQPGLTIATSLNIEKTLALYDFWDVEFKSQAFLYRQIRNMMAILIAVGNGRVSLREVYEMLTIPSKHSWNYKITPMHSCGLYLTNVEYPAEAFVNNYIENGEQIDEAVKIVEIEDDEKQRENDKSDRQKGLQ